MKKIFLLLLFFLFSCSNDYSNLHEEKNEFLSQNEETSKTLSDFSYEKISYLSGLTLNPTPDLGVLYSMVDKINSSHERVYVEVYIFTEKRLRKALIEAHKRGVEVKVLLEKNVYKAPYLNNDTFKALKNAGIDVRYSNADNYSLNHTKMMIVDDEAILSTGNYSYSSFKYNREFFVNIKDAEILKKLLSIYDSDFSGKKNNIYNENLVLSPFYSRFKIEYLLKNSKKNIKIYSLNFGDNSLENIVKEKAKDGINVKIIFPSLKKVDSNADLINSLKNTGIFYKLLNTPDTHAKSILIDDKYLYIGSVNFSTSSMDKNREIGILISNSEIISIFLKIFNKDFGS